MIVPMIVSKLAGGGAFGSPRHQTEKAVTLAVTAFLRSYPAA